ADPGGQTDRPMTVRAAGVGLFDGKSASVAIEKVSGGSVLVVNGKGGALSEWSRAPAFRTTAITHPSGARLACVEHLFAALAAFGAHENISIKVAGEELPILDGASAAWCALLAELEITATAPHLVVARDGEVAIDNSKYLFLSTETRSEVSVEIDLHGAGSFAEALPRHAEWNGTRADFVSRIAAARTFIAEKDLAEFERVGASAHLPPESFVVLCAEAAAVQGAPFVADEPARHKLLDLVGDFFLWGGPPRGRVEALYPGHAKSHEAIAVALKKGILARI
ncbi:MAG: UDP-3-O-acyl-N-acetylglucosamine deacetylase, partial [Polyangiaceae bacterium]